MELETAVERLYTDESLAADVDDKTAMPLLKWAESLLPALIAQGDDHFDAAFITLKKLIKSIARLIDMRGEIDMTERAERAEKIQGFAQELGVAVNVDQLESLASFDGPALVAQMVGDVTASTLIPSPPIHGESSEGVRPSDEGDRGLAGLDAALRQEVSADSEATAQHTDDRPALAGMPEDPEEAQATPHDQPVIPYEKPPVLSLPAEATPTSTPPAQPTEETEKPSMFDGIGAFFQRIAGRLEGDQKSDQPDEKE